MRPFVWHPQTNPFPKTKVERFNRKKTISKNVQHSSSKNIHSLRVGWRNFWTGVPCFFKHSFTSFSYPLLTDGSCVADTLRNLGAIQLCLCTLWLRIMLTTNQQEVPKLLLHHQMNLPWPTLNNFQVCCTTADSVCCCDCGSGEGGWSSFYGRGHRRHRSRGCRSLFFLFTILGG